MKNSLKIKGSGSHEYCIYVNFNWICCFSFYYADKLSSKEFDQNEDQNINLLVDELKISII